MSQKCLCLIFKGYQATKTRRLGVKEKIINKSIEALKEILTHLELDEKYEMIQIPLSEDCLYIYLSIDNNDNMIDTLKGYIITSRDIQCQIKQVSPLAIKKYKALKKKKEENKSTFKIGDWVRILTGDYSNCNGEISKINEKKKEVYIQIKLFSNVSNIEKLSFKDIEKIDI